jgi:hypothetical protein
MHGICKPFQVNFHVLPFKIPSKYFSFCDTVFSSWGRVVVGFAIFHIVYFKEKKRKKKERKKTLLHGM